jgi:FMN phosphatase YigB (HAD superfamily)
MSNKYGAIITDLDNTIYDWVSFFSAASDIMIHETAKILNKDVSQIQKELKAVNKRYGSTETPFALLEIKSIQEKYHNASREDLYAKFDAAFYAFNKVRKEKLALYVGVLETLQQAYRKGIKIIGFTEAPLSNAVFRLHKLNIAPVFSRLYSSESIGLGHPIKMDFPEYKIPADFAVPLPKSDVKPNPKTLLDICEKENIDVSSAIYVGDSIAKDIYMANEAGIVSAWAKYGSHHPSHEWDKIVVISHWSEEDIKKEAELRHKTSHAKPDFIIENFSELQTILW